MLFFLKKNNNNVLELLIPEISGNFLVLFLKSLQIVLFSKPSDFILHRR